MFPHNQQRHAKNSGAPLQYVLLLLLFNRREERAEIVNEPVAVCGMEVE